MLLGNACIAKCNIFLGFATGLSRYCVRFPFEGRRMMKFDENEQSQIKH